MHIDHIFLPSHHSGIEADEFIEWGLKEGSWRIHPGQGTRNRKFYFHNFFFELLWVIDEKEMVQSPLASMGLDTRMNPTQTELSPIGICLLNNKQTDALFEDALIYQPDYFPEGMVIEIAQTGEESYLPWLFRLPFRDQPYDPKAEPVDHPLGIKHLTGLGLEIPHHHQIGKKGKELAGLGIRWIKSASYGLVLEFDQGQVGNKRAFPDLFLRIEW